MKIAEALELTERAFHEKYARVCIRDGGVIHAGTGMPVRYDALCADGWIPDHPKTDCLCGCRKVECEACELWGPIVPADNIGRAVSFLLKQHCTCGGNK